MEIVVTAERVSLESYEDVKKFAVVSDLPTEAVADALVQHGWGTESTKPDHVYVSAQAVRSAAVELGADDAWVTGFQGMLAYAGSKNWLDSTGTLVLAHIDPAGTAT